MSYNNLTIAEIAYLAGFLDGDGGFYIYRIPHISKHTQKPVIHFNSSIRYVSTDRSIIKWVCEKTLGSKLIQSRPAKNRQYERDIFHTNISGIKSKFFAEEILPFLIVKKRQCELFIEFRKTYDIIYGSQGIPTEIVDYRMKIIDELHQINSRFHNHPSKQKNKTLAPCHHIMQPPA